MRIEGAIAMVGAAAQLPSQAHEKTQQGQTQVASIPANASRDARQGEDSKPVGQHMLSKAVTQVEHMVTAFNESVQFKIHEETNSTIIRVVNKDSGEVIREIPSEKFLDMIAMFQKQLSGLFVDHNG